MRAVITLIFPDKVEKWQEFVVSYIYDGDTIEVKQKGRTRRIRLLGINAPEIAHKQDASLSEFYGDESKTELAKLLPIGTVVKLEYEGREYDKYGRTLAYIWKDNLLINLKLVELGCAKTLFYNDAEKRKATFIRTENKAKSERLGMWAEDKDT